MYFTLSDDQREIKSVGRQILTRRCSPDRVREFADLQLTDNELWRELVEYGWPGISIPDRFGGQGLGVIEGMCLAEEAGYALASPPFTSTVGASLIILSAGSDEQKAAWLPKLATGEVIGSFGIAKAGHGQLVLDGQDSDVIVLVDDNRATLLERGRASTRSVPTIDRTHRYASVTGEGEPMPRDALLGILRARVLVTAELVGICQRALEMTVDYVGKREQFGRVVGSFQAVAHRCADMLVDTESARSLVYGAAWAADAAPERLQQLATMAAAFAGDAARRVTASALQAHGGIGFTWEGHIHWLLKRAQVMSILLGSPDDYRAEVAEIAAVDIAQRVGATF